MNTQTYPKTDILFFDVDGTIYTHPNPAVSQEIKKAIQKTRELGHLCFLSTGRPYSQIAENIREIGFDGMVLAHGAHIILNGKTVRSDALNPVQLKELCQVLNENDIEYSLYDSQNTYLSKADGFLNSFYKNMNIHQDRIVILENTENIPSGVMKMEFYAPSDEILETVRKAAPNFKIYGGYSSRRYDLYDKDKNKGKAVREVLEMYGDQIRDSYAFGDSLNDVEMLSVVDHPVIMENATEEFKSNYTEFCPSVREDGVALHLKKLYDLKSI